MIIMEGEYVNFFEVSAMFLNERVGEDLPEGIYKYELRGADYDPGHPLVVENHVGVNHAGTILTVVPLQIPEGGLRLGTGLDFEGGDVTTDEYLEEMEEEDLQELQEISESAIGSDNEDLHLSGKDDRYAIYQLLGNRTPEYAFMGMDYIKAHDMKVRAKDYTYAYGGKLKDGDTVEDLHAKFFASQPPEFYGHSASVSDVIVIQKDGEAKAYYVDEVGFTELPEFIQQRLREFRMICKREDSEITMDTYEVEVEQHDGYWHAVDSVEILDEIFFLMESNDFGDSVAAVIVDSNGELVAQDLENGFDKGAIEAINEYFSEKRGPRTHD